MIDARQAKMAVYGRRYALPSCVTSPDADHLVVNLILELLSRGGRQHRMNWTS